MDTSGWSEVKMAILLGALLGAASARAEEPAGAAQVGPAAVAAEAAPVPRTFQLGLAATGIYLPLPPVAGGAVWAVGVEAVFRYPLSERFDVRAALVYTHSGAETTGGDYALLAAAGTVWFGAYGLGASVAGGLGIFTDLNGFGWRGSSFTALLLGSPVRVRLGPDHQHELFLDAGGVFFTGHSPRPFARVGYGIYF
jgi:hypothetical protein